MWPSIRDSFVKFFNDKEYFAATWDQWVTKVRAGLMLLGAAVAIPGTFQDSIRALIPGRYTQYTGVVLMGLGVLLRAGDKNPKPEIPPVAQP